MTGGSAADEKARRRLEFRAPWAAKPRDAGAPKSLLDFAFFDSSII
jgi:hypothetical protein